MMGIPKTVGNLWADAKDKKKIHWESFEICP
jgi:hypothetical protein